MDIVICINKQYLMPAGVMLCSLFENNKEENIHIHAVLGEGGDQCVGPLEEMVARYHQDICFYQLNDSRLDAFPVGLYFQEPFITKEAYFRLFVMDVLPQELLKVLYLDVDMVICGSIRELWDADISDVAVGAVPDCFYNDVHETNRLGYEVGLGIFNSGVLLINLKYWREHDVMKDFAAYATEAKDHLKYHDQDVLNYVFRHSKKELPIRFNLQTIHMYHDRFRYLHFRLFEEVREAFRHPVVIHYTGPEKPWYSNAYHPLKDYFEQYRQMTPWKDEPLRRLHIPIKKWFRHFLVCVRRRDMHFHASYFDSYFRYYQRDSL
ncbi:MAG: glycosyltransferase family 8 protein [Prevotella sp.]|nr:glycosyltransferase family 8 protein [Prevotella sp.]